MPKDRDVSETKRRRHHSPAKAIESFYPYTKVYDPVKNGSIDGTDVIPHDKGIVRAIYADYIPNKGVQGKPERTIFIGRLNPRTVQETIVEEFSKFGKIVSCRLIRDIVTGKSKCYAFIEYDSSKCAREAYRKMHMELIDNSEILVDYEAERLIPGWKPRRLGGGFGGRKESGQLRFGCRIKPFNKPIVIDSLVIRNKNRDDRSYNQNDKGLEHGQKTFRKEWR